MAVDKQAPRPSEGAEESTGQWLTINHAGVEEESGLPEGPGWSWLCPAHVRVRNCIMEPPNQTIEREKEEKGDLPWQRQQKKKPPGYSSPCIELVMLDGVGAGAGRRRPEFHGP